MNSSRLRESIKAHEGYRQTPYRDHLGNWSVGWGRLIHNDDAKFVTVGILLNHYSDSNNHILWLEEDMSAAMMMASRWFSDFSLNHLSPERAEVIVEMCFQLGGRAMTFRKFYKAVVSGDDDKAVAEMLDSRWYAQTPNRVDALVDKWIGEQDGQQTNLGQ